MSSVLSTNFTLFMISEQLKDANAVEHLLLSVYLSLGHNFSLRTGKINLLFGLSASLSEIRFAENRRECKCWIVMSKPGMDDHTELVGQWSLPSLTMKQYSLFDSFTFL